MKLFEYEGAALFENYKIAVPKRQLIERSGEAIKLSGPLVIKAQVLSGDRKKAGGIAFAQTPAQAKKVVAQMFKKIIAGTAVSKVLVAEKISSVAEYYVSLSFDSARRCPVLAVSAKGGSGISDAHLAPIDMLVGLQPFFVRQALSEAQFPSADINPITGIIMNLWKLFSQEKVIIAEINPLLKSNDGTFWAVDSKVDYGKRRSVEKMGGDIAVIASGGGASLINMDALMLAGGKPANYAEYSGNPPAEVVTKLTQEVLSQPGIKACWVVGGTASFTDIYETMRGFLEGLKQVRPRPNFPFVIRRGGPRQEEAKKLLREFAQKEGYEFHIYGSETPMVATAQTVVDLAYRYKKKKL